MQGRLGNAQKGSQGTFVTTTAAPSAGAVKVNGLAQDGSGKQHIIAQGAPAVPSSREMYQGLAFSPAGALYTTNTAVGTGATYIGGMAIRSDGALHVNTGTPAGDWSGGLRVQTGRVFIS